PSLSDLTSTRRSSDLLILVINLVLARPVIDAVLFSLAIAVGITPQLLPAVVTTSRPGGPGGPVPDCDRAGQAAAVHRGGAAPTIDRKSTRLNSSHVKI